MIKLIKDIQKEKIDVSMDFYAEFMVIQKENNKLIVYFLDEQNKICDNQVVVMDNIYGCLDVHQFINMYHNLYEFNMDLKHSTFNMVFIESNLAEEEINLKNLLK